MQRKTQQNRTGKRSGPAAPPSSDPFPMLSCGGAGRWLPLIGLVNGVAASPRSFVCDADDRTKEPRGRREKQTDSDSRGRGRAEADRGRTSVDGHSLCSADCDTRINGEEGQSRAQHNRRLDARHRWTRQRAANGGRISSGRCAALPHPHSAAASQQQRRRPQTNSCSAHARRTIRRQLPWRCGRGMAAMDGD